MRRWLMAWLLTAMFLPIEGGAQGALTVIELRYRQADELLPTLLPLVEPGGTLTGMNTQLFLRASPANQADIRKVIAVLDRASRSLLVTVAREVDQRDSGQSVSAQGAVSLGTRSALSGDARVWDSRSVRGGQGNYQVQVQEGRPALIHLGRSDPVRVRETFVGPGGAVVREGAVYRDLIQGFLAVPRLNGEQVTVDIRVQADQAGGRGQIEGSQLVTTVSGTLGRWIPLGGVARESTREASGALTLSSGAVKDAQTLWLKVEALP